jgi:hypothetical protein
MAIQLKPEQQSVVGQAIQAGLIGAPDDVVEVGVETIRLRLEARVSLKSGLSGEEWAREFHSWVQSHASTGILLTDEAISRESIYERRGE